MRKLTLEAKKSVNAGAASMMGIATGVLTVTGVFNLILDLFNRYFRGSARNVQATVPSCEGSVETCLKVHPELWAVPEEHSNRITIFPEKSN
ncbi:hypothetical protein [Candidatus Mycoplasma haematominutum]|uniref:Uncharacterized protein n=1 Tax=Candidatus Mycoplasma haematominutum 'Birmingham 1' TaxID=1116213 RepID=G8C3W2_9MOLU|nr:hypothetical protein [Candidatus Mycoplasma haematominutum]CCE67010.1 hypothetical protein (homolog to MSU_0780) [Candidatus Mycoplasma haematominutum 'Birmingham 1']